MTRHSPEYRINRMLRDLRPDVWLHPGEDPAPFDVGRRTVAWFWSSAYTDRAGRPDRSWNGPFATEHDAKRDAKHEADRSVRRIRISAHYPEGFDIAGMFDLHDALDREADSANHDADRYHRYSIKADLGSDISDADAACVNELVAKTLKFAVDSLDLWTWNGFWLPAHEATEWRLQKAKGASSASMRRNLVQPERIEIPAPNSAGNDNADDGAGND